MSPWPAVSSYLTPFTLTASASTGGGIVSVALSLGSPPVVVNDCPTLCCPDFPPHASYAITRWRKRRGAIAQLSDKYQCSVVGMRNAILTVSLPTKNAPEGVLVYFFARSTRALKAEGSFAASSASDLRSSSTPAALSLLMKIE